MINMLAWIFLATIFGQIIILFLGYTFLHLLMNNNEFPVLQKLAISYGLGSGILAISMFICIVLGLHSRVSFIPIILITSCLFFYLKIYKIIKKDAQELLYMIKRKFRFNNIEYFCLILLSIEIVYIFSICLVYPLIIWDPVVIWEPRARYIFYDGNFSFYNYYTVHLGYPILTPLCNTFFYSLYLQPHSFIQLHNATFLFCLMIFLFYSLRNLKLDRTYSVLITTLIMLIPEIFIHSTQVTGDFLLTLYYTMSTVFLSHYFFTRKTHYLLYSSVFMGLMAFTKNEGLGLAVVNIGVFLLYLVIFVIKKENDFKEILKQSLLFIIPGLILYMPWMIFSYYQSLSSEYLLNILEIFNIPNMMIDLLIIFIATLLEIIWAPFWIIFFSVVLLKLKNFYEKKLFFLLVFCFFHIVLKTAIYVVSPYEIISHLILSYNREFMHLAPFAGFTLGVFMLYYEDFQIDLKNNIAFQKKVVFRVSLFIMIYIAITIFLFNLINLYVPTILQGAP